MKKVMQGRNKATLLLLSAILMLCLGFILAGCGVGPAAKAVNPDHGQYALDFTDCPVASCIVAFSEATFDSSKVENKPLTIEAWVKPKATSTGTVFQRMTAARGIALSYTGVTSTTSQVTPVFTIRRAVSSASGSGSPPTSTVSYTTNGTNINTNTWSHIAGILVYNEDATAANAHAAVHTAAGVACAGVDGDATDDTWHMDIYVNGTLSSCAETYGGTTAAGDADPTSAANAYVHEPTDHSSAPGTFSGLIDEARLWNTERTITDCMNVELAASGTCSRDNGNLLTYLRFNEGEGHTIYDWSGLLGTGGKEYGDPNNAGEFLEWNTGWSTDTPF